MEKEIKDKNLDLIQKLIDVDAHLGRKKSAGHPKMRPYIFTTRQNTHIINVEKTAEKLQEASEVLKDVVSKGGVVLFVAVTMPAKPLVKAMAEELNMPYVSDRWIGGTLTNFNVISKRINYLLKQEERKAKGEFEKYTKKEQLDMEEEIKDLEKKIGGIKNLKKHPDMIFLVDVSDHAITVTEANKVGVPVLAVSNTNTNPELVTHLVPANDKSVKSLKFVLGILKDAMLEGLKKTSSDKE